MAQVIKLNKEEFPFVKTNEGEKLLQVLSVNMDAVKFGKTEELLKYAYCMCAGASLKDKKEFPFTLQQFTAALPAGWQQQVKALINTRARVKKES